MRDAKALFFISTMVTLLFVQKLQPVSAVAQDAWRGLTAALQG